MNVKLASLLAALSLSTLSVPVIAQSVAVEDPVLKPCIDAWKAAKVGETVDPLQVDSTKCVTVPDTGGTWGAYTLLSTIAFTGDPSTVKTHLIGMDGSRVKTWPLSPFPAKMLPNGNVIAGLDYAQPSQSGVLHQESACLVEMDWNDRIVWPRNTGVQEECVLPGSSPIPFDTEDSNPVLRPTTRVHHDFQREGNPVSYYAPGQQAHTPGGKMLILGHANPPIEETLNVSDKFPLEDDPIYEVSANGKTILWRWNPYQHIDEMGFDAAAREAIRLKANVIPSSIFGTPDHDWLHINDANYLGPNKWCLDPNRADCDQRFHPDNIIFDSREANFMAIIARHDYPAIGYKEGEIVWKVGPNYGSSNPQNTVGQPIGQLIGMHHAHMIPQGLPGAGHILVFDNGGAAGYGLKDPNSRTDPLPPDCKTTCSPAEEPCWPNELSIPPTPPEGAPTQCLTHPNKTSGLSRVIEFDPTTLQVVWKYENAIPPLSPPCTKPAGGDFRFFSLFISSAQRLPNGNTLIDEGASGRVFEVTPQQKVVWEFVNPFGNEIPGGVNGPGCTLGVAPGSTGNIVYRAYRVPAEWVPKEYRSMR